VLPTNAHLWRGLTVGQIEASMDKTRKSYEKAIAPTYTILATPLSCTENKRTLTVMHCCCHEDSMDYGVLSYISSPSSRHGRYLSTCRSAKDMAEKSYRHALENCYCESNIIIIVQFCLFIVHHANNALSLYKLIDRASCCFPAATHFRIHYSLRTS
jgi:hypothetical protein